jgi:hypothetical protein
VLESLARGTKDLEQFIRDKSSIATVQIEFSESPKVENVGADGLEVHVNDSTRGDPAAE